MPGRAVAIVLLFTLCGCDRLLPFGGALDRSGLTDRSSLVDGAIGTDRRADLEPSRLERGLVDGAPRLGDHSGLDGAPGPLVEATSFHGSGGYTVPIAKSDLQIVLAGWKSLGGTVPTVSVPGFDNASTPALGAHGARIWWAQNATSATVSFDVSVDAVIFTIALQGLKQPQPVYWTNSGSDAAPKSTLFPAACRALVDVIALSNPVSIVASGAGQVTYGTSPGPVAVASYSLQTQPGTQTTWTLSQPTSWYIAAMCLK